MARAGHVLLEISSEPAMPDPAGGGPAAVFYPFGHPMPYDSVSRLIINFPRSRLCVFIPEEEEASHEPGAVRHRGDAGGRRPGAGRAQGDAGERGRHHPAAGQVRNWELETVSLTLWSEIGGFYWKH
jgi:hypothetical protein